ncbi:MAG: TetR/AcrR family transcriptional regulator, partial [Chloroflexi bacterium]|nr:TetR/AcrR family transcriptional regulator [Chloroflexota bacterium]
ALEAQGVVVPAEATEGTRQAILEAALALFADRGFAATSVADVAERAGVSKAAIYWHFRDKEALLEAAFVTVLPVAKIDLALRDLAGLEPEAVLIRVAEEYLAGFHRLLRHFRVVLSDLDTFPRFREFMNRYVALELVGLLARYFDQEVRTGRLASNDPCLAAQMFYSTLFGFVIMRDVLKRDDLGHLHDRGLARTVAHAFLEGLRPRDDRLADHSSDPSASR